ncbi:alpha-lytic protease prodomain-containing protein [Umezawaea sp. Da 62-37]|uniref:alpha-lytic protease prodomain-containing protein n=1 Tax=Umezawaea sp. Da 62-37 TaxID=3075927 RepID=UPI0028F6DFE3|nr:alpha-lytic protease prodomain-containing protein [Umezawaea sp. Da 62-37]WNV87508.1 alpha-lytic protease prodomain-containing protein [Umezawaea sp. Da 62-37]
MKRNTLWSTGAFALALVVVGACMQPAVAADDVAATSAPSSPKVSAALSATLQRDLHLTADQAALRLAREEAARVTERHAQDVLGSAYAGSWFDADSGKLVALSTDPAKASALAGKDIEVRTAARTAVQLDAAKTGIDALANRRAPAAVNSWYVDVQSNSVVIDVNRTKLDDAAKSFLDKARAGREYVRVVESTTSPRPLADVVGGWPYYINSAARCSVGFTVYGGFVSAGHCGRPGDTVSDNAGTVIGSFAGSTFPTYDYSWVSTNPGVTLWGYVEGYNGSWYYVRGSAQAAVGSGICRSGSTTGLRCGTILGRGETVNYPQGTVYNLTRTNVCAEPGDSGGSWISANQAQGVTSGGSGNCTSGGTTYYQEVNPILAAYGLTLILT